MVQKIEARHSFKELLVWRLMRLKTLKRWALTSCKLRSYFCMEFQFTTYFLSRDIGFDKRLDAILFVSCFQLFSSWDLRCDICYIIIFLKISSESIVLDILVPSWCYCCKDGTLCAFRFVVDFGDFINLFWIRSMLSMYSLYCGFRIGEAYSSVLLTSAKHNFTIVRELLKVLWYPI